MKTNTEAKKTPDPPYEKSIAGLPRPNIKLNLPSFKSLI